MGMGDKKPSYTPSYHSVRCDVSGKMFTPLCVRSCPEPHVIKKYGVGGKATVSVYVCRLCRYHEDMKMFGGVKCKYLEQKEAEQRRSDTPP